jgi:hypothetical protein
VAQRLTPNNAHGQLFVQRLLIKKTEENSKMKKCRFLVVVLLLAFALLTASAGWAQTILIATGSSGVFATTGLAAISTDPVTAAPALCGSNFWSGGSGSPSSLAFAIDSRNAGIPHEPGTVWVAWDNDTVPTKVCAYLSVDSVVGSRLFLSQTGAGNATFNLNTSAQFTVGANKVSFAADNTSCAASGGNGPFSVDITEPAGTTATVTVHGGGNFGNGFANGALVTITGGTPVGFNVTNVAIGGVGQLGPASFTYTTGSSGLGTDNSGAASATVAANCPGLPAAVFSAINGKHFTMAFTDIRPEDGHATFVRATCALNAADPTTPCMGYSSAPTAPQGIRSSYSQDVAFGLDFALYGGNDPITTVPVPSGTIHNIGAVPVMYIASNRDAGACGLGNPVFNNVNVQDVQSAFRGLTGATQDISSALVSSAAGCPAPLNVIEREPYSGTYNTQEWQVTRSWRGGNNRWSQENGNVGYPQSNNNGAACPAWASSLPTSTPTNPTLPPAFAGSLANGCGNPLNIQSANYPAGTPNLGPYGGFGGARTRAIGTGQVVAVVNSTNVTNVLGYAFYSLGTFGGKANVKYVMLDGADPLWPAYHAGAGGNPYGAGVFPTCTGKVNLGTFNCPSGQPTFDGVTSGRYSNWNIIRALYYGPVSTCAAPFTAVSAGCLIQAAQDQANPTNGNVRDYVPVVYCNNGACSAPVQNFTYFRSHYKAEPSTPSGHNGHVGPPFTGACVLVPESGGDVFGSIFTISVEVATLNSIGCTAELTGYYQ